MNLNVFVASLSRNMAKSCIYNKPVHGYAQQRSNDNVCYSAIYTSNKEESPCKLCRNVNLCASRFVKYTQNVIHP